jgi:hypothetical protein
MEQEKKKERYIKLLGLINNTYKDGDHPPFTPEEKREFGEILADNMTPWEVHCDINDVGDVWVEILADYNNLNSINLTLEFIGKAGYVSVEDWIRSHGLPLPDREDMMESLINDIDEEKYINECHDNILNTLPDYCENSIHDNEIIYLFEIYVDEINDGDRVICDAAMGKVLDKDSIYRRIKIKERTMNGSIYYNVYVDEECVGYRFSYDEAIIMGETYITNEVNV